MQILWFNLADRKSKHNSSDISSDKQVNSDSESLERSYQRLVKSFSNDYSSGTLNADDVIFLNPDWLMGCIKKIVEPSLIAEILTKERGPLE